MRWETPGWYRPILGGLFGFLGGVYFMYTGNSLSWRAGGDDPLLPMEALFDIHPLFGLTIFTAVGFGIGWLEWRLESRYRTAN